MVVHEWAFFDVGEWMIRVMKAVTEIPTTKWGAFILLFMIALLLTSVFGMLYGMLAVSISEEFYIYKELPTLGLESITMSDKLPKQVLAGIAGFLAWLRVGLFPGFILPLMGLFHEKPSDMVKYTLRSIALGIGITVVVSLVGALLGMFWSGKVMVGDMIWRMPPALGGVRPFIVMDTIYYFSYMGGIIGLMAAIVYMLFPLKNLKLKKE